jgi:hypothetical protein
VAYLAAPQLTDNLDAGDAGDRGGGLVDQAQVHGIHATLTGSERFLNQSQDPRRAGWPADGPRRRKCGLAMLAAASADGKSQECHDHKDLCCMG